MIDQERTFPLRLANREAGLDQHISTLFRYANPGLRGIRLETIKKGGATHTSREALGRFFAALTERRYGVGRPRPTDDGRQALVARELEDRFGL